MVGCAGGRVWGVLYVWLDLVLRVIGWGSIGEVLGVDWLKIMRGELGWDWDCGGWCGGG